ncbi:hypothetical protein ANTRET_LOCUS513 [Anthophora retusa]
MCIRVSEYRHRRIPKATVEEEKYLVTASQPSSVGSEKRSTSKAKLRGNHELSNAKQQLSPSSTRHFYI